MLPFPYYISRNQIDTNKTITKIGGQIPVAGMISYRNTLPYSDLLSGVYPPPLHMKPGPQEELNNKNPFRREHILGGGGGSVVLCKQKWHSGPQNNQAWATVAVFPITWLHVHGFICILLLPVYSAWTVAVSGTLYGFGKQINESQKS